MSKIKVGFVVNPSENWLGGFNYFKNLFFAIKKESSDELDFYVFTGRKNNLSFEDLIAPERMIKDDLFDRFSLKWFLHKFLSKTLGVNFLIDRLFAKYKIQIISHSGIFDLNGVKIINWIPDFQSFYLPNFFSKKEVKNRALTYERYAKYSDFVVLSSQNALLDFNKFYPEYSHKADVLRFVSQPVVDVKSYSQRDLDDLLAKYDIPRDFFYIPNQFWIHKNHQVVLEAVNILKKSGFSGCFVFTGSTFDYRNPKYFEKIEKYIDDNDLNEYIKILGVIDYLDVFKLINFSICVINPSLFEGWSSTVEECKSLGKSMILSDIDVHKEQCPNATFFEKTSSADLAEKLSNFNRETSGGGGDQELIDARTREYALKFEGICRKLITN